MPQWAIDIMQLVVDFELSASDKRTIKTLIASTIKEYPNDNPDMLYNRVYPICKRMIWKRLA